MRGRRRGGGMGDKRGKGEGKWGVGGRGGEIELGRSEIQLHIQASFFFLGGGTLL